MVGNLFINSPAYYSQNYGVIDEIYQMCSDISNNIDITEYTSSLETIGIVPILAPKVLTDQGQWKGHVKINLSLKMAIISLNSSYEDFCSGDLEQKKEIIVKNLLDSLFIIKKRLKDKFNYDDLERKILEIVT